MSILGRNSECSRNTADPLKATIQLLQFFFFIKQENVTHLHQEYDSLESIPAAAIKHGT